MENKSKYFYLLIGIIVGGLIVYGGMSFIETNSIESNIAHQNAGFDEGENKPNNDEEHSEIVKLSEEELKVVQGLSPCR